jgi:RNA polymerase sigma-70 factor, ECF subfamily
MSRLSDLREASFSVRERNASEAACNQFASTLFSKVRCVSHSLAPTTPFDDEQSLLAGLRARNDAAFTRFESLYAGQIYAVARRMLRDESDAQDAVQDAFIGAYKSLSSFDGRSKLSTWLTRIAINKCLMRLRSRRRSREVAIESLLPTFKDDGHPTQWTSHWRDDAGQTEEDTRTRQAALVRERIDELPEHYRVVLVLRDVQGLSTEETAASLGDTENAVKVRLHRARLALRTLLDPHMSADDRTPRVTL